MVMFSVKSHVNGIYEKGNGSPDAIRNTRQSTGRRTYSKKEKKIHPQKLLLHLNLICMLAKVLLHLKLNLLGI